MSGWLLGQGGQHALLLPECGGSGLFPVLAEEWGPERRRASGQKQGGIPALGLGHTQVTLQCLFNLLRKFLSLCDLCNTNELWAINDGFKASGLGFVTYGWERWGQRKGTNQGLAEDFMGGSLGQLQTQAQDGSGPLGGPEGREEERMEEHVGAGS